LIERDALKSAGVDLVQWRIVFVLARDGAARPSSLALRAEVPRERINRSVAELERRGLLRRTVDPADRRRSVVEATEAGVDLYRRLRPRIETIADEFRALYTEEEYRTLMLLLERALLRADVMLAKEEPEGLDPA
jgi:DNA-binding MarR family transcriptional regulator